MRRLFVESVRTLRAAGISEREAKAEARWLLSHARQLEPSGAKPEGGEAGAVACRLQEMLERRTRDLEPVQYICGEVEFHDLSCPIAVQAPVLIPRPETEELVEHVLRALAAAHAAKGGCDKDDRALRILDIGCGTGAIGLALLDALAHGGVQNASCMGIDVSRAAVELAMLNAKRLEMGPEKYTCVESSFKSFAKATTWKADVVVSNPPYVATADLLRLQPEVKQWEDPRALDGGPDGMDVVREIIKALPDLLDSVSPVAQLWMEVGLDHPRMIQEEFPNLNPQSFPDLSGRPRFVKISVANSAECGPSC